MPNERLLSKREFVLRVSKRAAARSVSFSAGRLDEWMKLGLVSAGRRERNEGTKPIYVYGYLQYRRVLQLLRLRSAGITDRDALLVQLFIRGYGVRPYEVREALLAEYRHVRAQQNRPVRSIHVDRAGEIPPSHKKSLLKQFGPADPRYVDAGVVPLQDQLIQSMRAARSPFSDLKRPIDGARKSLMGSLDGLLAPADDGELTHIEDMILKATDADLLLARACLGDMREALRRGLILVGDPIKRASIETALKAPFDRQYAAIMIVAILNGGRD